MSIEGRAAIITGGGTGVGRATALGLARLGVNVAVNYSRSADEAAATARDCEAEGVEALALQADVASNAAVVAMVAQAAAALGRVDYLVNSAGTTVFVSHEDLDGLTEESWQRVMGVNLLGAFYATRAARRTCARPAPAPWSTCRRWRASQAPAAQFPMPRPRARSTP